MEKIKLIYILSLGHSGSTLLDLIIGSAPEVFRLGELAFYSLYRDHSEARGLKCTCGRIFSQCLFWVDIKKNYIIYDTKILFKKTKGLFKYLLVPYGKPPAVELIDDTVAFLEDILNKSKQIYSENIYLLDSSKSLVRYLYLSQFPEIEIYPILLVRDGRGVLNSNMKWKKNKGFFKIKLEWIGINALIKKIAENNPNFIHISYKLFCKNPKPYIRILNKKLKINISEEAFLDRIAEKQYHHVDGNRLRFQRITEIRCDEKWKYELRFLTNYCYSLALSL